MKIVVIGGTGLIEASGIPYTIVRSTQLFEFLGAIAQPSTHGQTIRLSPAKTSLTLMPATSARS